MLTLNEESHQRVVTFRRRLPTDYLGFQCMLIDICFNFSQVAQLWQRDRAMLDTFAISVQRCVSSLTRWKADCRLSIGYK